MRLLDEDTAASCNRVTCSLTRAEAQELRDSLEALLRGGIPGGAYVHVYGRSAVKGARRVYPNYTHQKPGTRMDFWHYDPESPRGWNVYGQGSVNAAPTIATGT
jgi:hypothetical protein